MATANRQNRRHLVRAFGEGHRLGKGRGKPCLAMGMLVAVRHQETETRPENHRDFGKGFCPAHARFPGLAVLSPKGAVATESQARASGDTRGPIRPNTSAW